MPKFRNHLSKFNFGEVSPKVDGRTDLEAYRASCKQLKNFINLPGGGITKRYGTKKVADKRANGIFAFADYDAETVLMPYTFSNGEKYIITLRPNSSGYATVLETSTKRQFAIFNDVYISPGLTTGFTRGASAYNVYNGYASDTDLSQFQYSQTGDFLHVVHPDYPPFIIIRQVEGDFRIIPFSEGLALGLTLAAPHESLPYLDINTTGITLAASVVTLAASPTITASAAFFDADHVGSIFASVSGGVVGYFIITAVASSTSATAYNLTVLPTTGAIDSWHESAWSNYRGWPRTVTHVNNRVVYGGTKTQPDTFWFSKEGDVLRLTDPEVDHQLTETLTNDDAFRYTLTAGQLSEVNWMKASKGKIAFGTDDFEYTMFTPDGGTALGALNFQMSVETSYGSEHVQALTVGSKQLFVSRGGQKLRDFFYSREANGYISNDLSVLADHFAKKSQSAFYNASLGKIRQLAFQKADDEIIWVLDTNNFLYAVTKSESAGITSFHEHELGGSSLNSDAFIFERPRVLQIVAIKSPDDTHDELWLLVERSLGLSDNQISLEYIGREFTGDILNSNSVNIEDHPVFMDSAELLKKDTPMFFASYDSSFDAVVTAGSGTGTAVGSPPTPAGDLDLSGGAISHVDYTSLDLIGTEQTGCIRFKFKPDFTATTLAANYTLFSINEAGISSNEIRLTLQISGTYEEMRLMVRDSAGTTIINNALVGANVGKQLTTMMETGMGTDKFVEIELNYDLDSGETRVFIGGTQVGATQTGTGTRAYTAEVLRVGTIFNGTSPSDGFVKDFQIYDSVQHTANYKPLTFWDGSSTVRGLDYYKNHTVSILRDGKVEAAKKVSSAGVLTLDEAGDRLLIGLAYTSKVETMEIEDGASIGSAQGAIKRLDKVFPRFFKSANASVGSDPDVISPIEFRDYDDDISQAISLKTGIREVDYGIDLDVDSKRQATFYLESDAPLPCTVVSVTVRGVTGD